MDFSPFSTDHTDQAVALSQAEAWPHRREDWDMLMSLSTGRVALEGDTVVGTALRTDYGPDVSMVNMIIVGASHRGRGLGRRLMEAVMDAAPARELRLFATKDGLPLYEKLGFVAEGAVSQCQGLVTGACAPGAPVSAAGREDLEAVIALDQHFLSADRSRLLHWLAQNAELAVIRSPEGEVTGYAAARRFGRGHVIGPIVTPQVESAKDLICHFAGGLTGKFMRIDADDALGLAPWLETIGLERTGGAIKMRKNTITTPRPVFGCCSQALG
ncbi:GNAT family N-acetyltransferase [uncultured Ruegeria sp.]|uniref:GNAT family N-acetyltransferase n=1 Tax=uncultured Ruegeria sp. TaxID=259304 RepID=UPI00260FB436|nr:GNAT family N-acetyltransferase [uncultured Ruegeria sp.]